MVLGDLIWLQFTFQCHYHGNNKCTGNRREDVLMVVVVVVLGGKKGTIQMKRRMYWKEFKGCINNNIRVNIYWRMMAWPISVDCLYANWRRSLSGGEDFCRSTKQQHPSRKPKGYCVAWLAIPVPSLCIWLHYSHIVPPSCHIFNCQGFHSIGISWCTFAPAHTCMPVSVFECFINKILFES